MYIVRYPKNPVLAPKRIHSWEATATFNCCPVRRGDKIYLVYRAVSLPQLYVPPRSEFPVSSIGVAVSVDGLEFHDRRILVAPSEEWDLYGCEDPRVTYFEGKYYIFYTALSNYPPKPEDIKIGVAISSDLERVEEKHLVTHFNSKAMALFPERIKGKIWAVLTVHTDKPPAHICLASFDRIEQLWDRGYWEEWYSDYKRHCLPLLRSPEDHLEVGAPPIKTKYGWLLFYSYIRRYFTPNRLFTVEAVLLDLENPYRIISRTRYPLLTPEEYYERYGYVPNVVFPSGAIRVDNKIYLYYGAADTTCAVAFVDEDYLLARMLRKREPPRFQRAPVNPIIEPRPENPWESKATFNPGAVYLEGKVHIVYRAMGEDNTSVFGYAYSTDGIHIDYRHPEPIYVPREEFELKAVPGANSGAEDPRLTVIGDRIYMTYTAFNGRDPPRVAVTSIKVDDFLSMNWKWEKPIVISPPGIDDKDAFIFPEKVVDPATGEEKYLVVHRIGGSISSSLVSSLDFREGYLREYRWITPRPGYWDCVKIGAAAPPIKTEKGWIMLYHGVDDKRVYRVGAVLLDPENPLKVIARTDEPLFEPEAPYETVGLVNNVVFPTGVVLIGDTVYMYYGGADRVVGVATIKLSDLLEALAPELP